MKITKIFDLLDRINTKFSEKEDFLIGKDTGEWVKYSPKQYSEYAYNFAYGLIKLGYKPGDKIATVSNNRPEWNFIDMGMSIVGVVNVPIYPTITTEEFEYILKHCDAKTVILSDKYLYKKINPIAKKIKKIKNVYTINSVADATNWSEIVELGKKSKNEKLHNELIEIKNSIKPDNLFSIIYTSGTTNMPKGVMLSHKNFVYQMLSLKKIIDLGPSDRALSFLPICHVLERVVNYVYQYLGISIYYAEGLQKLTDNIQYVKPHVFTTVPRVIERVYDKIISKGKRLDGIKKKLFFWANDLALDYELSGKGIAYKTKHLIADSLIFSQWRKALGGYVKFVVSGGAALQTRLAKVFWGAGIPIREGYGLTETSPVIAFNHLTLPNIKFGTVGPKIGEEQEIKIAEDGEILFKGPNLMLGYYKNQKLTDEVIDKDGWFHTGDVGILEDDKFLKITDRKKEIFKLSTGKYVAPQPIESLFKESEFIEQIMVIGDNQKLPGAIITPTFENLHDWATENKIKYRDNSDLVKKPEAIKKYKQEVIKINKKIAQHEKISVFKLVCDEWTPATGELSPTLKKKRKFIANKYKTFIEEMF